MSLGVFSPSTRFVAVSRGRAHCVVHTRSTYSQCVCSHDIDEGISFETEVQLRERGTSRTPDVLLSCPLGVEMARKDGLGSEWKVICWIDSKVR
jgi:hypothetical protein